MLIVNDLVGNTRSNTAATCYWISFWKGVSKRLSLGNPADACILRVTFEDNQRVPIRDSLADRVGGVRQTKC